jgi:hypothetical protein
LDVIEHNAQPEPFLRALRARHLVVKVPLANGPIATLSRVAANLGWWRPFEALFLVGDPSPHVVLYTTSGLRSMATRSGWRCTKTRRIADVGAELPARIRFSMRRSRAIDAIVAGAGCVLEVLAVVWSDSVVAVFER